MRAILPLAFLAVAACYTPRAVERTPGPWDGPDAWGIAPLEASLFYDEYSGYAYFDLSRPANVAIFALRPGGGMEMIYPAIGIGRQMSFTSGRSIVRTTGSPYRLTGNWSMTYGQGPMYILLVASDDELDVGAFRATGTLAWLNRSAVTYNPYVALDALVGEIVPRPTTSAWTTAMHVVWPTNAWPDVRQRTRYHKVQCASGVVVVVPTEALFAGYPICPEDMQTPPAEAEKGEKSRQAFVPQKGEPPAGWMTASIGDLDLGSELERLRQVHGKTDWGELAIRPFPAIPPEGRTRGWARSGSQESSPRPGRTIGRPEGERSRATGPSAPAPAPKARPAPPSRPANPPSKPTKPKKPGGGGEKGGSG